MSHREIAVAGRVSHIDQVRIAGQRQWQRIWRVFHGRLFFVTHKRQTTLSNAEERSGREKPRDDAKRPALRMASRHDAPVSSENLVRKREARAGREGADKGAAPAATGPTSRAPPPSPYSRAGGGRDDERPRPFPLRGGLLLRALARGGGVPDEALACEAPAASSCR